MQKTRKTYYANGTDIGDAMIHRGIYYLNGAEATARDWTGKPSDWSDIRKDCPANSIALYAGHTADYSSYDNLGFTATCVGGYKVYIDGNVYGSYASGSTCNITWSSLALQTGDSITTPTALTAHKIWIEPATEGNNITAFHCDRVAASGTEQQGVLWGHFNLSNNIDINYLFSRNNYYRNFILVSCTAKNNFINNYSTGPNCISSFALCYILEYLPNIYFDPSKTFYAADLFNQCRKLKQVNLKGILTGGNTFYSDDNLEKIKGNVSLKAYGGQFYRVNKLKKLPQIVFDNAGILSNFLTDASSLEDTILDTRAGTGVKKLDCYGTSQYFMGGFKGLRVSNEAPFDNATAPQINVSYTGMDRDALVQLFNDLPYNVGYTIVGSPTIENSIVSDFSSSNYVTTNQNINFDAVNSNYEIVAEVKPIGSSWEQTTRYILGSGTSQTSRFGLCVTPYQHWYWYIYSDGVNNIYLDGNADNSMNNRTTFIKAVVNNKNASLYKSLDGQSWSVLATKDLSSYTDTYVINSPINIGVNYNVSYPWIGSIDLNNTYIKVNDIYFFRGQPAMTKTLSCVGCTGTADLTQDDKDIALNKGWSLTLS